MEYKYLTHINSPKDLKSLNKEILPVVCQELRDFIIHELSHNPGHLASSLGTIELTVALHYVYDTPNDQIIWDVGHQAYAHKILTGRREQFHTNRQFRGLAPFPTPKESEYDAFIAGHASNSISAALGIEVAAELTGKKQQVVAVIGDGSMTGGLAFEGLNNTSMDQKNMLIILNDNHMAIDPIRGGFTQYLVDITTSAKYNKWRWKTYQWMLRHHLLDESRTGALRGLSNSLKTFLTHQPKNIFQGLDLRYFGPTDGHNVLELIRILTEIKTHQGPKVLHIITTKGKGYEPAEHDQTTWHAPGEFNATTGVRNADNKPNIQTDTPPLWQEVFGNMLLELAQKNEKIVGVTPAMPSGCSMTIMQKQLPERVFDVGIAEGHAVTFSAGMAKNGLIPYCNIYSSFLQRAYDNIIHDVSILNLHVVLCIDRAGIVGNDGATHHGLLDLAYLRPIPNLKICAPRTASELCEMMQLAETMEGPVAIRYPRGRTPGDAIDTKIPVQIGKGICLHTGNDAAVLTIGPIGNTALLAINHIEQQYAYHIALFDMRWLKPVDETLLETIRQQYKEIITIEDGTIVGGLGTAVAEWMSSHGFNGRITRLGINDCFVEHGSTTELYHLHKLDKQGLCESLLLVLEK